jgi:hypothetical protein
VNALANGAERKKNLCCKILGASTYTFGVVILHHPIAAGVRNADK